MICPYCGSKLKTINSRWQKATNTTWRRKECPEGHIKITTVETMKLKPDEIQEFIGVVGALEVTIQ